MAEGLDVKLLKRKLETRFQLALVNQQEIIDGGSFDTIRLLSMEQGNGFVILLARTHRQFEASFKADNFAGALLRAMSEADVAGKQSFTRTRQAAETGGTPIFVAVNGNANPDCIDLREKWSRVEIDVSKRFPSSMKPEDVMATALQVTSACLSLVFALAGTEAAGTSPTDSSVSGLPEGAKLRVEVNRYERSPVNRAACIDHYGLRCQCCKFDFLEFYGELGEGYVEVHHRTPVSQIGAGYLVDPVRDLVPLCGNCHSMVHRTDPPFPVEKLRVLIETRRSASTEK